MIDLIGRIFASCVLAFFAAIILVSIRDLLPQYDCSKHGHKDPYYGCTTCTTPYAHKDKYRRPCCWVPAYAWICGVCHMKVPAPKQVTTASPRS